MFYVIGKTIEKEEDKEDEEDMYPPINLETDFNPNDFPGRDYGNISTTIEEVEEETVEEVFRNDYLPKDPTQERLVLQNNDDDDDDMLFSILPFYPDAYEASGEDFDV